MTKPAFSAITSSTTLHHPHHPNLRSQSHQDHNSQNQEDQEEFDSDDDNDDEMYWADWIEPEVAPQMPSATGYPLDVPPPHKLLPKSKKPRKQNNSSANINILTSNRSGLSEKDSNKIYTHHNINNTNHTNRSTSRDLKDNNQHKTSHHLTNTNTSNNGRLLPSSVSSQADLDFDENNQDENNHDENNHDTDDHTNTLNHPAFRPSLGFENTMMSGGFASFPNQRSSTDRSNESSATNNNSSTVHDSKSNVPPGSPTPAMSSPSLGDMTMERPGTEEYKRMGLANEDNENEEDDDHDNNLGKLSESENAHKQGNGTSEAGNGNETEKASNTRATSYLSSRASSSTSLDTNVLSTTHNTSTANTTVKAALGSGSHVANNDLVNGIKSLLSSQLKTPLTEDLTNPSCIRRSQNVVGACKPKTNSKSHISSNSPHFTNDSQNSASVTGKPYTESTPGSSSFSEPTFFNKEDSNASSNKRSLDEVERGTQNNDHNNKKPRHRKRKAAVVGQELPSMNTRSRNAQEVDEASANDDFCSTCLGVGRFLCCEGCPKSFHFSCVDPPLDERSLPEGEWFCKECTTKRNPPKVNKNGGIFNQLLYYMDTHNPVQFSLPKKIKQRFEDVLSNEFGEYADTDMKVFKSTRSGFVEEDPYKLVDKHGNPIFCYKCKQSSLSGGPIARCEYCSLNWHLDCLNPPLPTVKTIGTKWKCPNHADHVFKRKQRRPRLAKIVDTDLRRGFRNDGDIEIMLSSDEESQLESRPSLYNFKHMHNGNIYPSTAAPATSASTVPAPAAATTNTNTKTATAPTTTNTVPFSSHSSSSFLAASAIPSAPAAIPMAPIPPIILKPFIKNGIVYQLPEEGVKLNFVNCVSEMNEEAYQDAKNSDILLALDELATRDQQAREGVRNLCYMKAEGSRDVLTATARNNIETLIGAALNVSKNNGQAQAQKELKQKQKLLGDIKYGTDVNGILLKKKKNENVDFKLKQETETEPKIKSENSTFQQSSKTSTSAKATTTNTSMNNNTAEEKDSHLQKPDSRSSLMSSSGPSDLSSLADDTFDSFTRPNSKKSIPSLRPRTRSRSEEANPSTSNPSVPSRDNISPPSSIITDAANNLFSSEDYISSEEKAQLLAIQKLMKLKGKEALMEFFMYHGK